MSSIYFTGIKNHESGMTREYVDGSVKQVVYPTNYRGKKYTFWEINRKEGKLKKTDKYNPFIGEEEEWSLSTFWEDYSMYIIGVIVLLAAIIAFLVYRNMGATQVVENIAAAFGLV